MHNKKMLLARPAIMFLATAATIAATVGASSGSAAQPTTVTRTYGSGPYTKTITHHVLRRAPGIEGVNASAPLPVVPSQMMAPGTPMPVSPQVIQVSNSWTVSDGNTLVAVYAGQAGDNPTNGRFVIVRQTKAGAQTVSQVDVPGAGTVTIGNAPSGSSDQSQIKLPFDTASGGSGTLNLANDTTTAG